MRLGIAQRPEISRGAQQHIEGEDRHVVGQPIDSVTQAGAHIGPYSVIGRQCHIEEHAVLDNAIVWANSRISQEAVVRRSILGRHCHIGRNAVVEDGVVLGDKSVVTDYSRL